MEKEVFSDCGAWKNFHDLEDSLTLEELSELYDIAVEKQNRLFKFMAMVNGLDVEEDSSVKSGKGKVPRSSAEAEAMAQSESKFITSAEDLSGFQYGLGYETVSST